MSDLGFFAHRLSGHVGNAGAMAEIYLSSGIMLPLDKYRDDVGFILRTTGELGQSLGVLASRLWELEQNTIGFAPRERERNIDAIAFLCRREFARTIARCNKVSNRMILDFLEDMLELGEEEAWQERPDIRRLLEDRAVDILAFNDTLFDKFAELIDPSLFPLLEQDGPQELIVSSHRVSNVLMMNMQMSLFGAAIPMLDFRQLDHSEAVAANCVGMYLHGMAQGEHHGLNAAFREFKRRHVDWRKERGFPETDTGTPGGDEERTR